VLLQYAPTVDRRLAVAVRQARPDDEIHLVYPPPALCTGLSCPFAVCHSYVDTFIDNAVMIAWAGMPRLMTGDVGPDELSLAIKPVWSIEDI
jgi:tRNA A37 threonylcarbamoyltransferase TsaD